MAEEEDELEQICELPHVPDAMEHGWLRRPLGAIGTELLRGALASCRHLQLGICARGCRDIDGRLRSRARWRKQKRRCDEEIRGQRLAKKSPTAKKLIAKFKTA